MNRPATKRLVKEHPEEAVMQPALKAELEAFAAMVCAYLRALRAYETGDGKQIWEWVEAYMGVRLDTRLKDVLQDYYLPDGGSFSFPYVCRLLKHHSTRTILACGT
jgi:hypothetical protein